MAELNPQLGRYFGASAGVLVLSPKADFPQLQAGDVIVKVDGKVPVPFVKAPLIDLAVSWHSLWYDHAVVAKVLFISPEVNFVDGGANNQASKTGKGTDWREQ